MPLLDQLKQLQPATAFLSKRRLVLLLDRMRDRGDRVARNADRPLWVKTADLPSLGEEHFRDRTEDRLLLLAPPDDRSFFSVKPSDSERFYHRLLFRAAVQDVARAKLPDVMQFWNGLTFGQQREIEYVLAADHQVPESPTAEETALAAAEILLDLVENVPEAIPGTFPLLDDENRWAELRDALGTKDLAKKNPTPPPEPIDAPLLMPKATEADLATAKAMKARGNFVSAIAGAPGTEFAEESLKELTTLLLTVLDLPEADLQHWIDELKPLAQRSSLSAWPREKRALYELQRLAGDFQSPLDAVAPVEWIASFGRKPLRRPLDPVKPVIVVRRLRAALKHVQHSDLEADARHKLEHTLETAIHHWDRKLRYDLRPVIEKAFDDHGFTATCLPETIARDRIAAELLDRLSERGFLKLGDLRDAIARNDLKLRDLTFRDALLGDQLLLIDKRLHDDLFGVYRRGEVYLRGVQRFSGWFFGTMLGRWITLFLALPFGGAFLAIEAIKHIGHALEAIALAIASVITRTPVEKSEDSHGHGHGPGFDHESLMWIGGVGAFFFLLINVPPARRVIFRACGFLIRRLGSTLLSLPNAVWMSPPVRWLMDNMITRFISDYILWPAFFSALVTMTVALLEGSVEAIIYTGAGSFILALVVGASPLGHWMREATLEAFHDFGRRFAFDILPGLFRWTMQSFRSGLAVIERGLYSVDEWFRYREGQSKPSLALKAALGLLWFPIAYVVRFAFNLLIEPQVNPIKHFPVVTVSHKVLLPLIPTISEATSLSLETVGVVVTCIPGIFGFLVWEFKENWRLYASNRSPNLKAVPLGHHGETMRGLLRPGFHSGTVPKHFRKFRRLYAKPAAVPRTDLLHEEEHHVAEAVERLVVRSLFAYWNTRPAIAALEPHVAAVRLGAQRIEVDLGIDGGAEPMKMSFENFSGTIVGTIDREGWMAAQPAAEKPYLDQSLRGFFASAAVTAVVVPWESWKEFWAQT